MQGGRPRVTAERVRVPRGPQEGAPHPVTPVKAPQAAPKRSNEPHSPHSPRVGEVWRTGAATSHAWGWFRPSPPAKQRKMDE